MSAIISPPLDIPPRPARIHLFFLDGIRGIAALAVMLSHLWRTYTKVPLPGVQGWFVNWMGQGHVWVDVFIVLSGFCLMIPVTRTRALRDGWQGFYRSRAKRILPPLYAALALAVVLSLLHHWSVGAKTLLANVLLLQDLWQSRDTLDGPLWSVALEWKIYFLFPLFIWLWLRSGTAAVFWAAAAISAALFAVISGFHLVIDITHTCPWYVLLFAMGMVSADMALRPFDPLPGSKKLGWLLAGVAAWEAVSWFWPKNLFRDPVGDTVTGFITCILLMMLTRKANNHEKTPLLTTLSWKPVVFIGEFAYSIYLIHVLLIYDIRHFLIAHLPYRPAFVVIPIDMAIVVGVAYLFHLAFERPFMSRPGQSPPRTERQAEVAAIVNPAP